MPRRSRNCCHRGRQNSLARGRLERTHLRVELDADGLLLIILAELAETGFSSEDASFGGVSMTRWTPDPTFYPSPRLAAKAPAETLAYIAVFKPERKVPDALAVVDVDPSSASYAKIVGKLDLPSVGDELHHFGWNACSSCLCPNAPHPHVERRYLIVPGLRSSRIYVIDTKPDLRNPKVS